MRRIHRGGEGQYLLNRNPVRRLDVLELLADVGLGGEMHAIISQGRVDAVLASKPADRRALIEEAAGLGSFKQRRRRAELKLKRVSGDVDRARDLESEVKKRLRPLALQASAAERAEKLRVEIAEQERRLWSGDLAILDSQATDIDGRKAAADSDRRRADEALEGLLGERGSAEKRSSRPLAAMSRLRRLSTACAVPSSVSSFAVRMRESSRPLCARSTTECPSLRLSRETRVGLKSLNRLNWPPVPVLSSRGWRSSSASGSSKLRALQPSALARSSAASPSVRGSRRLLASSLTRVTIWRSRCSTSMRDTSVP